MQIQLTAYDPEGFDAKSNLSFQRGALMIYDLTIPQFSKMLKTLDHLLEIGAKRADEKKFDVEVLLNSRLAPDQFHLTRQVQIACDTAKFGAARLTGKEAPSHPDTEKTLGELKDRIESTLKYLSSFKASDFAEAESRLISHPRWEGKSLTGKDFVIHNLIPNFYFHVVTAYSILRHNGIDVGKRDYLGQQPFQ